MSIRVVQRGVSRERTSRYVNQQAAQRSLRWWPTAYAQTRVVGSGGGTFSQGESRGFSSAVRRVHAGERACRADATPASTFWGEMLRGDDVADMPGW